MLTSIIAALIPILSPVEAVLTDIEGTTTSISYVKETLFPYAKQQMQEYVSVHQHEPEVKKILSEVQAIAGVTSEEVVPTLLIWMGQDKKLPPLKALQGLIWEEGYRQGAFQGHIYGDVYPQLNCWKNAGIPIYVYSSGSVKAQKLLFTYSCQGDITSIFSDYFDTAVGGKKESASYQLIAKRIGIVAEHILFLSDSIDELDAAKAAGMQTVLVCRDELPPIDFEHPDVTNFYEIWIMNK